MRRWLPFALLIVGCTRSIGSSIDTSDGALVDTDGGAPDAEPTPGEDGGAAPSDAALSASCGVFGKPCCGGLDGGGANMGGDCSDATTACGSWRGLVTTGVPDGGWWCARCGGPGQPCCDGACNDARSTCADPPPGSAALMKVCQHCGLHTEPCCVGAGQVACDSGFACTWSGGAQKCL